MKKLCFTFLILLFISWNAVSQVCLRKSEDWLQKYRLQSTYVPNSSYEAVKTIPINIVFFGDDSGNYFPISPDIFAENRSNYEQWINLTYLTPQASTCQTTCPQTVYDTRIRIVINKVYFLKNTKILNDGSSNQVTNAMNFHLGENPEAVNFVNCYLVRNSSEGLGYASFRKYKNGEVLPAILSGTGLSNKDKDYVWVERESDSFYFINHIHHEIAHLLGLYHTYNVPKTESLNPDDLDFLCDVFGSNPALKIGCNNVMGGQVNAAGGFSPLQMGRMHRGLSTDAGDNGEGVRILRHYAYGYSGVSHKITGAETWDFVFKSYNDIVVKSGASLTLKCRLEMVPQAKIIVEQGGKLILDGGTITSARNAGPAHEGLWQGIEIRKAKLNRNADSTALSMQGIIELKNEAVIENANIAIKLHKKLAKLDPSGWVWMSNASIRNCKQGILFSTDPIKEVEDH